MIKKLPLVNDSSNTSFGDNRLELAQHKTVHEMN